MTSWRYSKASVRGRMKTAEEAVTGVAGAILLGVTFSVALIVPPLFVVAVWIEGGRFFPPLVAVVYVWGMIKMWSHESVSL